MSNRCQKYARSRAIAIGFLLWAASAPIWAATATTTTLTVPPSPIKWPSPVTLKATVNSGGISVQPGLVTFCNATAASCSGTAVLGQAQLTATGIASLKVVLSIGTHSIKAVFAGTNAHETSSSAAETVTIMGVLPTQTAISSSGTSPYSLTATVTGNGSQTLSGNVSFVDSSNGNYLLGNAALGAAKVNSSFTAQIMAGTGSEPAPLAVGDFNGDGIPDLVVGNVNAPNGIYTVTVFLSSGPGTYAAPQQLELPSTFLDAAAIAVGDFNNDGCLDLAMAGDNSGSVLIGFGSCQGTFVLAGSPISMGATSVPNSIAVGDFNNDGILDLAVTSRTFSTVTILLGNGNGAFTTTASSPSTGTWPYSVAVGDFNGDGKQDLAVANYFGFDVTVLLGKGDGTFTPTASSPATGVYPGSIAAGDFNGDGNQDLAVANQYSKDVTILLGDGKGDFSPTSQSPATGLNPDSLTIADFNRDGIEDLAVANSNDNTVTVLLGKGDGTFPASMEQTVLLPGGTAPSSVTATDFNADGRLDFAVAGSGNNTVVLVSNTVATSANATISGVKIPGGGKHNIGARYGGNANYAASTSGTIPLTGTPIATTVALAIEPAGTVAIGETVQLTATISPALVGGLRPSGTVSFYNGTTLLATVPVVTGVAVYNDKLTSPGTESLSVKYSGDLNFTASASNAASATVIAPIASTTALRVSSNSVTNGTIVTLTATVTSGGTAVTHGTVAFCSAGFHFCEDAGKLGSTQLTSSGTATIKLALPVGTNSIFASFGGTAEVLASKSATQGVTVTGTLATTTALVASGTPGNYKFIATVTGHGPTVKGSVNFFDNSDNNLSLGTVTLTPAAINSFVPSPLVNIGGFPEDVIATDLNGDGKLDLVATNATSAISVLLGSGNGGLSIKQTIPVASSVSLALGDFNNDGKPDIASVNQSTSKVDIFLGNGDGTLSLKTSVPVGAFPFGITVADFNGDGIADVAVGNGESSTISVLLGNGDGTFTADPVSPAVAIPGALASGDFNGDGKPDLAAVSENGVVYILLGNGDGTFQQTSSIGVGIDPGNIKIGDFNADGIADLVVVNVASGNLSVLLGNGNGAFQSLVVSTPYQNPGAIAVGDLNGDGKSDMVLSDGLGSTATIYISNGNGTFAVQTLTGPLTNAGGIAIGDFDDDGFPDIAFSQHTAANVGVLLGKAVSTATLTGIAAPGTGTQNIKATYTSTAPYSSSTSPAVPVTGTGAKP